MLKLLDGLDAERRHLADRECEDSGGIGEDVKVGTLMNRNFLMSARVSDPVRTIESSFESASNEPRRVLLQGINNISV
jgi:hypothetical protein